MIKFNFILLKITILALPFVSCSQQKIKEDTLIKIDTNQYNSIYNPPYYEQFSNKWTELEKGLSYIELDAPRKDKVGDSKISILKINPENFSFEMLSASQTDSVPLCVVDWAEKFNLKVVINAGMYDLKRKLSSKGLLQNDLNYSNNSNLYEGYNSIIAFNPIEKGLPNFDIIDLKCNDFSKIKNQYQSYAQGLRMIDCEGNPMSWNKNPQWCSQLIVAKDKQQFIYFIFTRSPYSHNEMIQFMLNFEVKLVNAIYMEGGPQTSLFVDTEKGRIEKLGSYVSKTYATDKNAEFWALPNVIGIRKK